MAKSSFDPPRILMLPPLSYKYLYGGILHRTDFAREVASLNYEVFAIGDETVPANHLRLYRWYDPTIEVHKSPWMYLLIPLFFLTYAFFVLFLIYAKKIKAVFLFYPPGTRDLLTMTLFTKIKFKKKLIIFLIGYKVGGKRLSARIKRMFDRVILGNSDALLSISRPIANSFVKIFRIDPRKIVYINYGVGRYRSLIHVPKELARKKLNLPLEQFIALMVARYDPYRGCQYFLKAAEEVQKVEDNVLFVLVGARTSEKYEAEIKRTASEKNIKILFVDNAPYTSVPLYMRAADCLVLASPVDNWCATFREGLANALPIVCFSAGIHEKLPGVVTVKTGDSSELASAILKLIRQPKLKKQLSKKAYSTYDEKFNLRKEIPELMNKLDLE